MRVTSSLIVCLLAVGCATADKESTSAENQGIAELRADAASLQAFQVTRVTVAIEGQTSQDLVFNSVSGTYDAALFLTAGTHTLTARAFAGDAQVGSSNPVTVAVQPGGVTRVVLRIIDTSNEAPLFGPLIDSVVFPTSIEAGGAASFTVAVVAPGNDPTSVLWSTDCGDSSFTAPDATTTSWTKPTPGSCQITVSAGSNGFVVQSSFTVVVFPVGAQNGAVDASGVFVAAPQIQFFASGLSCSVFSGINQTCQRTLTAPTFTDFNFTVSTWGISTPGSLTVSDNCGGHIGLNFRNSDFFSGNWLPPASGGLCILKAHAVNAEGGVGELSVAILSRPGSLPVTENPLVSMQSVNGCGSSSNFPQEGECLPVSVGSRMTVSAGAQYFDGVPGSLTITDDCGGGFFEGSSPGFLTRDWTVTGNPGDTCTVVVRGTNLQGQLGTTSIHFALR